METAPQNEPARPEKTLSRSWWRRYRRLLIIVGVTLLLTVGGNALWIVTHLPPPTPPQGKQCGSIAHTEYPPPKVSDEPASVQVIQCFWNAYQHCQAATIDLSYTEIDSGSDHTITIEKSGQQCLLFNAGVSGNNEDVYHAIFLCSTMTRQADGLHVSGCSGQDPYVISPVSISAEKCGMVNNTSSPVALEKAEQCFLQRYDRCYGADLTYITQHGSVVDTRHFAVNSDCKVAYQHGTDIATCDSAEQRRGGLYFFLCGHGQEALVPVVVPSQPGQ
ncbi:MAG: hypothetical protein H0W02_19945 [Ktedonobacteraceae bacterium]|nr:hypothetical protein [Ktedonobacteraceae bacterium]